MSEIQNAIELLSHTISGVRETAYAEEKAEEMKLLLDQLVKQRRMTEFQKMKLDWLTNYKGGRNENRNRL